MSNMFYICNSKTHVYLKPLVGPKGDHITAFPVNLKNLIGLDS